MVISCPEEAELRAAAEVVIQQVAQGVLAQRVGISVVGEGGSCSSMSRSKAVATLTSADHDRKSVAHQESVDNFVDTFGEKQPMTCTKSILEGGLHDHIPIAPPDEGRRVTVSKRLRILGEVERRQSFKEPLKAQVVHHHTDAPLRPELEDNRKLERRRHSISDAVPTPTSLAKCTPTSACTFTEGLLPGYTGGAASSASSLTDAASSLHCRVPCGKFDSKVLAFKQKVFAKGLSVGPRDSWRADRSLLEGDPWEGCDDIAEEDAIEWFSDFFARRDVGRRGRREATQEAVVAKAIASDQPCANLKHRLKKLVLEPVTLLADEASLLPLPEAQPPDKACCKEGAGAGQSDRDLSRMSTASCCSRGGNAPGSAPSTPGRSSVNAAATLDVVAQPAPDCAVPSGTDKDVQFRALCAVDEVWLRLGQGDKQALVGLLKETRRHVITTQVHKMWRPGKEMSRKPPESSSSAAPKSVLAGGLLAGGLEQVLLEEH